MIAERARRFIEEAPTTAAEAATIIRDEVKSVGGGSSLAGMPC